MWNLEKFKLPWKVFRPGLVHIRGGGKGEEQKSPFTGILRAEDVS
jgi:hypothetical protein